MIEHLFAHIKRDWHTYGTRKSGPLSGCRHVFEPHVECQRNIKSDGLWAHGLLAGVKRDSVSRRLQRHHQRALLQIHPPTCSMPMDPAAGAPLSMGQSPVTKFARNAMASFPYHQLIRYLMVATRPDLTFLCPNRQNSTLPSGARTQGGGVQGPRVLTTNSKGQPVRQARRAPSGAGSLRRII